MADNYITKDEWDEMAANTASPKEQKRRIREGKKWLKELMKPKGKAKPPEEPRKKPNQDLRNRAIELLLLGTAKKTDKPGKKAAAPPCKHPHLHFEAGGLYIVCANCNRAWVAVMEPMRIIQDVMARAQGLSELDRRSDPSAGPKPISKR